MVKPIPQGFHTVTPSLTLSDCAAAIELYKKAFGAEEIGRFADPSGKKIWHSTLRFGDSMVMMTDEFPEMGGHAQPASLWLYVENVDSAFKRAVDAGLKTKVPVSDMFWGDRMGQVVDRFGNAWTLAQRMKELSPEQMKKAGEEMAQQARKR